MQCQNAPGILVSWTQNFSFFLQNTKTNTAHYYY